MMPLKVTAAALSVLVHSISNSLCHFLKSQVTFTPDDLRAPTSPPPVPLLRALIRGDLITWLCERLAENARMDGVVNPPQSLLCRVQPSCACDAVMSSLRGCRGLNWPFGLDAVRLGRVQVKRRMRLSCWCDLKSHTLARLPQVAPSHKCGGSREEEEDEDRQKCRGEKGINVK